MKEDGKRIIFVIRTFSYAYWGGMQTIALNLSYELKKLGYLPMIYSTLAFSNKQFEKIKGIEIRRFPYYYLKFRNDRLALDRIGGNPFSPNMFVSLLKEKDLSLIHSFSHAGSLGTMVRLVSKLKRVPFFLSFYGESPKDTGNWLKPSKTASLLERILYSLSGGGEKCLKDSSGYITDNIDFYHLLKKRYPHKPTHLIPAGVNLEEFKQGSPKRFRDKYNIREKNIVLNVARICEQKNQIIIVRAMEKVLKEFPDTKLVIVGSVSEQVYYEKLKRLILESGYKDKILVIFGLKPGSEDLLDAYSACDLSVLADTIGGPCVTVYEVWAMKKPIIISRISGDPGIVQDRKNGLLFNANSSSDLADKIIELLSNREYAEMLGLSGWQEVKKRYTWKVIAQEVDSIYKEALSGR